MMTNQEVMSELAVEDLDQVSGGCDSHYQSGQDAGERIKEAVIAAWDWLTGG